MGPPLAGVKMGWINEAPSQLHVTCLALPSEVRIAVWADQPKSTAQPHAANPTQLTTNSINYDQPSQLKQNTAVSGPFPVQLSETPQHLRRPHPYAHRTAIHAGNNPLRRSGSPSSVSEDEENQNKTVRSPLECSAPDAFSCPRPPANPTPDRKEIMVCDQ